MLQWIQRCTYLFRLVFLFSSSKYTEMKPLDHTVVIFVVSWGTPIPFYILAAPVCVSTSGVQWFLFSHIVTNTCYFLSLRFLCKNLGYLFSVYLSSYKEFYVFAFPYEHQFSLYVLSWKFLFLFISESFVHFLMIMSLK